MSNDIRYLYTAGQDVNEYLREYLSDDDFLNGQPTREAVESITISDDEREEYYMDEMSDIFGSIEIPGHGLMSAGEIAKELDFDLFYSNMSEYFEEVYMDNYEWEEDLLDADEDVL